MVGISKALTLLVALCAVTPVLAQDTGSGTPTTTGDTGYDAGYDDSGYDGTGTDTEDDMGTGTDGTGASTTGVGSATTGNSTGSAAGDGTTTDSGTAASNPDLPQPTAALEPSSHDEDSMYFTFPSSKDWWVLTKSTDPVNTVQWHWKGKHQNVTFLLVNPNKAVLPSTVILARRVHSSQNQIRVTTHTAADGVGYQILMTKSSNRSHIFAASDQFDIRPSFAVQTVPISVAPSPTDTGDDDDSGLSGAVNAGNGNGGFTRPGSSASRFSMSTAGVLVAAVVGAACVL